jgi:hypothetical protein
MPLPRPAAALLALALAVDPARADLHVKEAVPLGDALLVRTKARELFLAEPGDALDRLFRVPEHGSPLVTDGVTAVSGGRVHDGVLSVAVIERQPGGSIVGRRILPVPRPMREGLGRIVAVDPRAWYFSSGARWDLERKDFVAGHLDEHPDLVVLDARRSSEGSILLCRERQGGPATTCLVTSTGLRSPPEPAEGARLVVDAESAYVVTPRSVIAFDAATLADRQDLSPMLPPGTLRHFSADPGAYWLESEDEAGDVTHWRVDRETLDFDRVELAGVGDAYRTLGDTGEHLWLGRPGKAHSIVLLSAPKTGGGAQGYRALGRTQRRARAFFRRTGRTLAIAGIIVTFPVSIPVIAAVEAAR